MMTLRLCCVCWNDGIRNPFHRYWKEKTRRENLSKFIYQLANTCFTAMVVVAAVGLVLGVEDAKPYALLLGVGLFSTIFLALFADNILKKK